jgi:benzoate membrane transport protein
VTLAVAIAYAAATGSMACGRAWRWTLPCRCSRCRASASGAIIGLALPLFVVTMASQNLPGVAAQRAAGLHAPVSPVITTTGVASLVLAPFGGYALNLAAITAAICMGPRGARGPGRRYMAAVMAGLFYIVIGCWAAPSSASSRRSRRSWCWPWPASRCWAPSAAAWRRR